MLWYPLNDFGIQVRKSCKTFFQWKTYDGSQSSLHRDISTRDLKSYPGFILWKRRQEFFMSCLADEDKLTILERIYIVPGRFPGKEVVSPCICVNLWMRVPSNLFNPPSEANQIYPNLSWHTAFTWPSFSPFLTVSEWKLIGGSCSAIAKSEENIKRSTQKVT